MYSASSRYFLVTTIACTSACLLGLPAASWGQQFIAHGGSIPEVRLEAVGRADLPTQIRPPQEISKQVVLLDGTPVKLQMVRTISSAHAKAGDRLDFVVVKDVTLDGFTVIQAGSIASGSVVGVRGKRILGIGGKIIIKLDSVTMVTGEHAVLRARKEIKGGSRTKLMLAEILATGLSYLPAAPVFLLSRGCDSTVLKGMEVTAYISGNAQLSTSNLLAAKEDRSELSAMIHFLPPRTVDGEGRDGDMLNLVFVANEDDLEDAFARAGWIKTDKTRFPAFWHLAMQRMHYAKLPMRRLFVFGRTQDYSYALPDSTSIVSKRHHLRIWKTDYQVDGTPIWVGAATYDIALQWQLRKLRIFHRIDPKVDSERDFIAGKLSETNLVTRQEYLHCANPVFKGETATGGPYYSDSRMLLVELRSEKSAKNTRQLALPASENSAAASATLNATR
jgi:LssY C-terminus